MAMTWWWLSFVDPERPRGQRFLGGALVEAYTIGDAIRACWQMGINPGGEVMSFAVPPEYEYRLDPSITNRLLTKAEIDVFESKWREQ
jgi:hypothetical protein